MFKKKIEDIFTKKRVLATLQLYKDQKDYDKTFQLIQNGSFQKQLLHNFVPDPLIAFEIPKDSNETRELVLNYGYGFLYNRIQTALLKNGLNIYYSFLHAPQSHKPTLVYDLIEEFRQPIVDREILSILAKKTKLVTHKGALTQKSLKIISQNIQERLATPTKWRKGKYELKNIIEEQAQLLARSIKNEHLKYKGFIVRY